MMAVDKKSMALSTSEAIREIELERHATTIFPARRRKLIFRKIGCECVVVEGVSCEVRLVKRVRMTDEEVDIDRPANVDAFLAFAIQLMYAFGRLPRTLVQRVGLQVGLDEAFAPTSFGCHAGGRPTTGGVQDGIDL
jgi:hypothetical protein